VRQLLTESVVLSLQAPHCIGLGIQLQLHRATGVDALPLLSSLHVDEVTLHGWIDYDCGRADIRSVPV